MEIAQSAQSAYLPGAGALKFRYLHGPTLDLQASRKQLLEV